MLSPKHQRYADRLRELIEEGPDIAKLERPSSVGAYFQGEDKIRVQSWVIKAINILDTVFGSQSIHLKYFEESIPKGGIKFIEHAHEVYLLIGVLSGALDDLEGGYLLGQEFLIAAEVFDSILEQSKHLVETGYKDPAAVLVRVVLEGSLKRMARGEGIDENKKASALNDELKKKGKYPQQQWRLIQAWLDIGNAAAHGNFSEYQDENIKSLIDSVEKFLASEFRD